MTHEDMYRCSEQPTNTLCQIWCQGFSLTLGPSINSHSGTKREFQLSYSEKVSAACVSWKSSGSAHTLDLTWSHLIFFSLLQQIYRLVDFSKPFMLHNQAWHMQIQLARVAPHGKHSYLIHVAHIKVLELSGTLQLYSDSDQFSMCTCVFGQYMSDTALRTNGAAHARLGFS